MKIGQKVTIDKVAVVYGQKDILIEDADATVREWGENSIMLELDDESLVPDWAGGRVHFVPEMIEFTDYESLRQLALDAINGGTRLTV